MKLNNFEKQAQQKLNNREIKPSATSWDRLDAMLTVEEKPKKKGFFWINMAASFIVFASIGFYFYNQNEVVEPVKEVPVIVEVEEEKIKVEEEKLEIRSQKLENRLQIANNRQQTTDNRLQTMDDAQPTTHNPQPTIYNLQPTTYDNPQTTTQNKYTSAEKLLAEVSNTEFETNISEKDTKHIKKRISINPNTLLSNVENELDQSFREKALEKLTNNFNNVKTVLANRNYEE